MALAAFLASQESQAATYSPSRAPSQGAIAKLTLSCKDGNLSHRAGVTSLCRKLLEMGASRKTGFVTPRIIGGTPVTSGWLSQAALLDAFEPDGYQAQFCGGTLIAPYFVATAAHCVDDLDPSDVDVAVGKYDLTQIQTSDRIAVAEVYVHPQWDPYTDENDFAVLQLNAPSAQPVTSMISSPVPSPSPVAQGKPGKIAGWGVTDSGRPATILRNADVSFISDATCQSNPSGGYGSDLYPVSMICAGGLSAGVPVGSPDTCQGDSGGPLLAEQGTALVLAGITSWGNGCAVAGFPGVYSRVSYGRNWLLEQLKELFQLSVALNGSGSGTVASYPAGIDCGPRCSAAFESGSQVTLSASPASGATFAGWAGACSGAAATCVVSLSQARSVTATFNLAPPPAPVAPPAPAPAPSPAPSPGPTAPSRPDGKMVVRGRVASVRLNPEAGVSYSISASRASRRARGRTGKCKAARGRIQCSVRLTKGRWTVSVVPARSGLTGPALRKTLRIR